tara:strand:- start:252 stop:806 length:555 start_codon:yes stop_codon:yes gene_type:complete
MKKPLFLYYLLLFICCSDPELAGDDGLNETLEPTSASCENFLECNDNKFFIHRDNFNPNLDDPSEAGRIYISIIKFSDSDLFLENWSYVVDTENNIINFEKPGIVGFSNVDYQSMDSKFIEDKCEEVAFEISRNKADELSINLLERWPTNSDPFDFYESYRFLKKENGDLILNYFDDQGQTTLS